MDIGNSMLYGSHHMTYLPCVERFYPLANAWVSLTHIFLVLVLAPLTQAAAQASAPRHSPSGVGSPGPVEIIPPDPNANADGVVVRPWSQGSDFSRTRRRQLGKKMAELRPYNLV